MGAFINGGESRSSSTGWGASQTLFLQTLALADAKVFVKRVPVTQLEHG